MKSIKLGRKMSMPSPELSAPKSVEDEMHYPSLYLDFEKQHDLPDSGTMVIRFKKGSETNSKGRDGKSRQSVSLDVTEIVSVKPDDGEDEESTEDALERLRGESEESEEESED